MISLSIGQLIAVIIVAFVVGGAVGITLACCLAAGRSYNEENIADDKDNIDEYR